MHEPVTFESASKYITEIITDFKDLIVSKYKELQDAEWTFDKGSTKVCTADENGKKKRCKVGISYNSKVVLTDNIAVDIWNLFENHFKDSYLPNIERITGNEEMGRYAFSAKNDDGDMIECTVNMPGEWNIPLISITGYTTARYRNLDL
jgi:hypothetical protein